MLTVSLLAWSTMEPSILASMPTNLDTVFMRSTTLRSAFVTGGGMDSRTCINVNELGSYEVWHASVHTNLRTRNVGFGVLSHVFGLHHDCRDILCDGHGRVVLPARVVTTCIGAEHHSHAR